MTTKKDKVDEVPAPKKCGIVMPISSIDGCSDDHWNDVQAIIEEAIVAAGFEGNLVSAADDVGVIQGRIIQNLYSNPVVVCDVSCRNPNVMFELGVRLAFDKPTIIVKDDKTPFSFDTAPIDHLDYPRDLRFGEIVVFKEKLAKRIQATYASSQKNDGYSTFLKNFGEFKLAKIEQKELSGQDMILEELRSVKRQIARFVRQDRQEASDEVKIRSIDVCCGGRRQSDQVIADLVDHGAYSASVDEVEPGHFHLKAYVSAGPRGEMVESMVRARLGYDVGEEAFFHATGAEPGKSHGR